MSDPFIGEIRIWAFSWAPAKWSFCDGQILEFSQHTALGVLLGAIYGGDGKTTFALPDLRGRTPVGEGSWYTQGEKGGSETVTLGAVELPGHTHDFQAVTDANDGPDPTNKYANTNKPKDNMLASTGRDIYNTCTDSLIQLSPNAITTVGNGQSHNNLQPYLALNYCISMEGIWPPRDD